MKKIILGLFISTTVLSCDSLVINPKPVALFSAKETDLGKVKITNLSKNASTYIFEWGDGSSDEGTSNTGEWHTYNNDGEYTIKLTAIAANPKNMDVSTQKITVSKTMGTALFYMTYDPGHGHTNLEVDGNLVKRFTSYVSFPETIVCGTTDNAFKNIELKPGVHSFKAYSDDKAVSFSGNFTIENSQCLKIKLSKN